MVVRLRGALASLLWVSSLALASVPALGASPSPEPTQPPESGPPHFGPGQAWLDAPLPTAAPAGTTVLLGACLWSPDRGEVVTGITPRFRLHPASGKAADAVTNGTPDWPGHYTAQLAVPPGGFGRLDIGIPGSFCDDAGNCVEQEFLFDQAVGPPLGVKLPAIATAQLALDDTDLSARTAIEIQAFVSPNADWPGGLELPARLVLQVRERQGPVVLEVPADAADFGAGYYLASIIVDRPGDYVAQLAAAEGATGGDLFSTGIMPLTITARAGPTPVPAPTAGGSPAPPEWWPLALGAFGLIVAALLFFRGAPTRN
jgi:hypothetical protein